MLLSQRALNFCRIKKNCLDFKRLRNDEAVRNNFTLKKFVKGKNWGINKDICKSKKVVFIIYLELGMLYQRRSQWRSANWRYE